MVVPSRGHLLSHNRNIKGTRNTSHHNVIGRRAMLLERLDGSFEQSINDKGIEARRHDRKAQIASLKIAFDHFNASHALSVSIVDVQLLMYSTTSRSNPESPSICFGAESTRIRVTPKSRSICAPMP